MPRKKSPIFKKISDVVQFSILIAAKMRNPTIPRVISPKNSRKLKKFRLLKHYNYGYIQEYQFSPSNSPLIHYHQRKALCKSTRYRDMLPLIFPCRCFGGFRAAGEKRSRTSLDLEAFPGAEDSILARDVLELSESGVESDSSVDERAERFIEWFYEEMRMQRKEQLHMLDV